MNHPLPNLHTPDALSGLALAGKLADELHHQVEAASSPAGRPGGMNYALPAPLPRESTRAILFYAIAAANGGWMQPAPGA